MILDRHQVTHRLVQGIVKHADRYELERLLVKSSRLAIDLNHVQYNGQSLLHLCCLYNRLDLLKFFVEYGQCDLLVSNRDGWLPLHLAVYLGHMNIVVYVLQTMTDRNSVKF
jgi:ankyrin repeat protein